MIDRKSIFASKAERKNFYALTERFGAETNIYHNIPFLQVYDLSAIQNLGRAGKIKCDGRIESRLKKTSIDYVVCSKDDLPLICIEFDGLQEGVNVGSEYRTRDDNDKWRRIIFELKLQIASHAKWPFVITRSKDYHALGKSSRLAAIDGILGVVLANKEFEDLYDKGFDPKFYELSDSEYAKLEPTQQHELAQNWLTDIETIAQVSKNPLSARFYELMRDCGVTSYSLSPREFPKSQPHRSEAKSYSDLVAWYGCECRIQHESATECSSTSWIPNYGFSGINFEWLAEDMAKLCAIEKLVGILADQKLLKRES